MNPDGDKRLVAYTFPLVRQVTRKIYRILRPSTQSVCDMKAHSPEMTTPHSSPSCMCGCPPLLAPAAASTR